MANELSTEEVNAIVNLLNQGAEQARINGDNDTMLLLTALADRFRVAKSIILS